MVLFWTAIRQRWFTEFRACAWSAQGRKRGSNRFGSGFINRLLHKTIARPFPRLCPNYTVAVTRYAGWKRQGYPAFFLHLRAHRSNLARGSAQPVGLPSG